MKKIKPESQIQDCGLRYKAKSAGSFFESGKSFGYSTMSCFLCGKHRSRAQLTSKKFIGKSQVVCEPSCKKLDELLLVKNDSASSI